MMKNTGCAAAIPLPLRSIESGEDVSSSVGSVENGLDFLMELHRGEQKHVGKRVAVVGAGFTALDCSRVAKRLGAEEVAIHIRTTEEYIPVTKDGIDVDNCTYCRACIEVAPRNCIKMVDGVDIKADGTYGALQEASEWDKVGAIWVDNNECIRCGACFKVCPTKCISITRNEIFYQDL